MGVQVDKVGVVVAAACFQQMIGRGVLAGKGVGHLVGTCLTSLSGFPCYCQSSAEQQKKDSD